MSIGGGKNKQKQTQDYHNQTGVDQATQAYINDLRNASLQAGQAGPSPLVTQAAGYNTGLQNAGNVGVNALSGDRNALATLMDPYQRNVIDTNNAQWQHTNAQAMQQVNDAATRARAFGGSRQGVATGVALANNNLAQQQQTAGLLSQGYNNAIGQAQSLAGLGFAGAGSNANLGLGGVGNPQQWLANMLKQGYTGPLGQTSSGYGRQDQSGYNLNASGSIPFFGGASGSIPFFGGGGGG